MGRVFLKNVVPLGAPRLHPCRELVLRSFLISFICMVALSFFVTGVVNCTTLQRASVSIIVSFTAYEHYSCKLRTRMWPAEQQATRSKQS